MMEITPELLDDCIERTNAAGALERSVEAQTGSTMELAWFLAGVAKRVLAEPAEAFAAAWHELTGSRSHVQRYARLFRPGLAAIMSDVVRIDSRLRRAFEQFERAMDQWCTEAKLAA